MTEIIPAIIARNFQELTEKIRQVEPYADWAQLDIMDGQFVNNITWNQPSDLNGLETRLNLEAHLMIQNPEDKIDDWLKSGVKRIIFHYESTIQHQGIIKKIKEAGLEAGLAINPETPINILDDFSVDLVLVMAVQPGQAGQQFLETTLPKIKSLREKYPDVKIGVDGGINPQTAAEVIRAGADILAAGSAIFESADLKQAIKQLKNGGQKHMTKEFLKITKTQLFLGIMLNLITLTAAIVIIKQLYCPVTLEEYTQALEANSSQIFENNN